MTRFIQRAALWVLNFFESGSGWSPHKSTLRGGLVDARLDVTKASREEIMRKARWFRDNHAVARRLGNVHCDFSVGANGIQFRPASSSEEWNAKAKEYADKTLSRIDLVGNQSFGSFQQLIAWLEFFDGDVFLIKTRGQDSSGKWWPRIQLIEAHLCSTPPDRASGEGKTIIDGVAVDQSGQPVGYWFKASSDSNSWRFVSADSVIHVMDQNRAGEMRGVSSLATAINYLQSLADLEELEFRAARTQADSATFITNAAGQLDANKLASRLGVSSKATSTTTSTQNQVEFYRELYGGKIFAGKTGDTFTHTTPTRPSDATRALWNYLTSCACAACGIPKMVAFSEWLEGAQGTVVRGDYDIAAQNFRARSLGYAALFREIYLYVLTWGIRTDRNLADPPADWFNVVSSPPRAVNVDVGRNSAAVIQDLIHGLTTHEAVYASQGLDARTEIVKQARFLAFVKKTCAEISLQEGVEVSPDELLGPISASDNPTTDPALLTA